MKEIVSVQSLVTQAQHGDRMAFDALMLHYQSRVSKLIARYIREPYDVSDVTQEAFIKALTALPRFRGDSTFYTWLYRIAINTAKNHLAARAHQPLDNPISIEDAEAMHRLKENIGPERILIGAEILRKTFAAIHNLPRELRDAILMREIEGLSYDEIADRMQCPIGTVRSRIFRARESIVTQISPYLGSGGRV